MKFAVFTRFVSLATLVVLLSVATLVAQQYNVTKEHSSIATLIVKLLEREHLSRLKVDDQISEKCLKAYLQELDPLKLYLLQSDVDELSKQSKAIDDMVRDGNLEFAFTTFKQFLSRLESQLNTADKLIDAEHDFTIDEVMETDAKVYGWAKSQEELNDRWRKRIKYDLLTLKIEDGKPNPIQDELEENIDPKTQLHRRYGNVRRHFTQMEEDDILEMFLTALTMSFDPHSSYMSPQSVKEFDVQMKLELDGIGASLRSVDGYTIVAEIVAGSAASKDGRLQVGDKIIGVGQETGEIQDIVNMKLTKVVSMIRGKRNTVVRLQVIPKGTNETKIYEIVRQKVEMKAQEVKGEIIEAGKRIPGATGKIGVISIPSFYRDFGGADSGAKDFKSTSRDVRAALTKFAKEGGVDAVVLDLRSNGGGALQEAIDVTGLFVKEGPVVQVKNQRGVVTTLGDEDDGDIAYQGPLVVICNRMSASASEIVAGALKDYRRAIVIGDETTHGKGTVQSVVNLNRQLFQAFNLDAPSERGAIKLTINQFYRINGDSTQNIGVPSDVILPSKLDHLEIGESSLDNAMAFDRIPAADHEVMAFTNGSLVSSLKEMSDKRRAMGQEFQELEDSIRRLELRNNAKKITINEAKFQEEFRKKDDQELNPEEEPMPQGDTTVFPKSFYNDEILSIALDYLSLLKEKKTAKTR